MGIKFYAHTNLAHHLESTGINRMHIFLIGLGIVMALIGIFMIFGWGIRDVLMARKLRRDNRYPPGFFKTTAYFNLMHNSPKRAALFLYIRESRAFFGDLPSLCLVYDYFWMDFKVLSLSRYATMSRPFSTPE